MSIRSDYCSSFLVNRILLMPSQTYSGHDPKVATKSLEFDTEAQLLRRTDRSDSLPNLVGLVRRYILMGSNVSQNMGAAQYVLEAHEMAKRLKVFRGADAITAVQHRQLPTEAAQ
ncbi:hypothetical protein DE146DRAFT_629613 [Phaeosphaeria sp. MPI-PUGE-AT-0046c]|nr:hypothetical protein DE146DRAFT_629613 [Phaeosphaeria sp. MPI-PUGE-AT-0046c]